MRYQTDQKKATHKKIVTQAARLFREKGYSACGVDTVMKSAGLTAGGFYSHFKSKDALLAEVLDQLQVQLTGDGAAIQTESDTFETWLTRYLSPAHLDSPATGCPLPSVGGEIPRQSKKVRAAFSRSLARRLERLAALLHHKGDPSDLAIHVLASAAGAMLIARAVSDDALANRILTVVKRAIMNNVADAG